MESNIILKPHQKEVLDQLRSGSVLLGDTGSGKTFTALFFYKKYFRHLPLVVITTAKKRDEGDWQNEIKISQAAYNYIVDSWNNINKYSMLNTHFFIFDEQRTTGYKKWSKTFIKISKNNKWILLTATPGDNWNDYAAIFIANGFYRNITDFRDQHIEYDRYVRYPKIKVYHNTNKLRYLRDKVLVVMNFQHSLNIFEYYLTCNYDEKSYNKIVKLNWDIFEDKPILTYPEKVSLLRKLIYSDYDRYLQAKMMIGTLEKVIVYYNYNFEREILINICKELGKTYSEWNGHNHLRIPKTQSWAYLVQYTSASESWNCTDTNIILFYSLNYSYKMMKQSKGRVTRMNTHFEDIYYYYLVSKSPLDNAIRKCLSNKENFNDESWLINDFRK